MVCEIGGDENDPDNSYAYAKAVIELVKGIPDNRGKGVFYKNKRMFLENPFGLHFFQGYDI